MLAKWLQSYPTLCPPVDGSPRASSVHGILQASILEWVAMPSSKGSSLTQGSNPCLLCLLHWQAGSLLLVPPGKPLWHLTFHLYLTFHFLPPQISPLWLSHEFLRGEGGTLYVSFLNLEVVPNNFNVQSAQAFLLQLNVFLSPLLEGNFLCLLLSTCGFIRKTLSVPVLFPWAVEITRDHSSSSLTQIIYSQEHQALGVPSLAPSPDHVPAMDSHVNIYIIFIALITRAVLHVFTW